MEILSWIFNALLMVFAFAAVVVMVGVVIMLILGFLGLGLCDIEYDEEDDRTNWPDPLA